MKLEINMRVGGLIVCRVCRCGLVASTVLQHLHNQHHQNQWTQQHVNEALQGFTIRPPFLVEDSYCHPRAPVACVAGLEKMEGFACCLCPPPRYCATKKTMQNHCSQRHKDAPSFAHITRPILMQTLFHQHNYVQYFEILPEAAYVRAGVDEESKVLAELAGKCINRVLNLPRDTLLDDAATTSNFFTQVHWPNFVSQLAPLSIATLMDLVSAPTSTDALYPLRQICLDIFKDGQKVIPTLDICIRQLVYAIDGLVFA